jgi:hypothetical protein
VTRQLLVMVGALDQPLHRLRGYRCAAAQVEVELSTMVRSASSSASTIASADGGSAAFRIACVLLWCHFRVDGFGSS